MERTDARNLGSQEMGADEGTQTRYIALPFCIPRLILDDLDMMTHTGASSPGSKMISPIYTNPFHFVVQKPLFKVLLRYITVASSDLSRRCFPHDFPMDFLMAFSTGPWGDGPTCRAVRREP